MLFRSRVTTIENNGLVWNRDLYDFIVKEALPGTGADAETFFSGFASLIHELGPRNRDLLARRDSLQAEIDAWYRKNGAPVDMAAYRDFLTSIGYLLPEGGPVSVSTANVDPEIASVAGPQLVVPVMNARYALNAANARWGSLYDALYGTDAIADDGGAERGDAYNPKRGAKVIAWARNFLDQSSPLNDASWTDVTGLAVSGSKLVVSTKAGFVALADPAQFVGYNGDAATPTAVLLARNGLHTKKIGRAHV